MKKNNKDEFHNREKKNLKAIDVSMETKLRDFRTRIKDIDGENVALLQIQITDLKKGIDYWQKESHHWYNQAIEMADEYNKLKLKVTKLKLKAKLKL